VKQCVRRGRGGGVRVSSPTAWRRGHDGASYLVWKPVGIVVRGPKHSPPNIGCCSVEICFHTAEKYLLYRSVGMSSSTIFGTDFIDFGSEEGVLVQQGSPFLVHKKSQWKLTILKKCQFQPTHHNSFIYLVFSKQRPIAYCINIIWGAFQRWGLSITLEYISSDHLIHWLQSDKNKSRNIRSQGQA
jgi:hypothetical protein